MTWQPKSTSPASFSLREAFVALITGDTTWDWLIPFSFMVNDTNYPTAAFCAAGPVNALPLDIHDFYASVSSEGPSLSANLALIPALYGAAHDRVFGAFCEMSGAPADPGCHAIAAAFDPGNAQWEWAAVPAGATTIRVLGGFGGNVQWAFWNNGIYNYGGYTMVSGWSTDGSDIVITVVPGFDHIALRRDGAPLDVEACGMAAGDPVPFVPTDQPIPPGVLPPATNVYTTIGDLGAELDRQEYKLDYIVQLASYIGALTPPELTTPGDDTVAVPGVPISLTGAVGFVCTTTGVPASADEAYGAPVKFHRVGRITLGSPLGWRPSIDIEHSPLVMQPLPPGVDRCFVTAYPPAVSTITPLFPPK